MSDISETTSTAAPEAPISQTIADYNQGVEAELSSEPAAPDAPEAPAIKQPAEPLAPSDADKGEIDPETPAADAEKAAEEETEVDAEGEEAGGQPAPTEFKLGIDVPLDEFVEQEKAYLETVEVTPELTAILARKDAEIASQREVLSELENVANKDSLIKLGGAMNRLFETEIDDKGAVKVNALPLVQLLRTDYKDEFRAIAEEIFASDSQSIPDATLFEEILVDFVGLDKANKIVAFAKAAAPLPVMAHIPLPQGVEEANKEAYFRLPEVKRYQIEGYVQEVNALEAEFNDPDTSQWRKEDIAPVLQEKRDLLEAEIEAVADKQRNINNERQREEVGQRQRAAAEMQFRNTVNTTYNSELFGIADAFAQDLAPRLTFADTDTQLSQARNIMSRVSNALDFIINPDGTFTNNPVADHYAKQLAEEGVKYDFAKGRELIQRLYKATEKMTALKARNASPQHIESVRKEKTKLETDIKIEQKQLLGQLSTKYVKSSGSALNKQIDAVTAKKQAVRSIVPGRSDSSMKARPTKDAIEDYNRRVAASTGDELFNAHAN